MHPDKVTAATRVILDALRQSISENREVRDAAGVLAEWLNETVSWNQTGAGRLAGPVGARSREMGERGRPPADLGLVIRRTALKAEACAWAVERQRMIDRGADHDEQIRPVDAELLDRARDLRGCWLWMFDPYGRTPEIEHLERLAGCYTAMRTAVEIVEELSAAGEEDPIALRDMYYLLAEAQSMLWAGLREAGIDRDQDQTDAFIWLREKTREDRVFVERHMRREDPADPSNWPDLQDRLNAFIEGWRDSQTEANRRDTQMRRLDHHVRRISEGETDEPMHDWARLSEIIEDLEELGVDPHSPELAEALAPLPDEIPDVELSEPAEKALNIEAENA